MARSNIVFSPEQLQQLQSSFGWLERHAAFRCGVLIDLSGQDIVHWSTQQDLDITSIASLAAADLLATMEISRMFGMGRACNLIIQEHPEQIIMVTRIGKDFLLLIAATRHIPLGWARVTIKQVSTALLATIEQAAATAPPQPQTLSDNFEAAFADQLEQIWE
jgi:predicted regulator of Ras-like GTPase activity (Roadblock/LC7/MglB family)